MDETESIRSRALAVIRRHFVSLWLAAAWPYLVTAICMVSVSFTLHARAATEPMPSPMGLWQTLSGLTRFGIVFAFIAQIFLTRDLGAVGVAMIAASDGQGQALTLGPFLSRYARIVWLLVPISLGFGSLVYVGSLFVIPGIFLNVWSAFVMPALASPEAGERRVRRSFRFTLSRFGPLLALFVVTAVAQIPALFALFIPIVVTADRPSWWVGQIAGWTLFVVLMGLIFMARSLVLALFYRDAVLSPQATTQPAL